MSQTVSGFGALSQSGLSQLDPSQDAYMSSDYQSQMDGLLSQDSTYQGGRSAFFRHGSQFTQVDWWSEFVLLFNWACCFQSYSDLFLAILKTVRRCSNKKDPKKIDDDDAWRQPTVFEFILQLKIKEKRGNPTFINWQLERPMPIYQMAFNVAHHKQH